MKEKERGGVKEREKFQATGSKIRKRIMLSLKRNEKRDLSNGFKIISNSHLPWLIDLFITVQRDNVDIKILLH